MPGSGSEILWAVTIGTTALAALIAVFIGTLVANQRKFVTIEKEKLEAIRLREDSLEQSNEQLHMLTGRLQSIREEERTRIAREVHDELGSMLTVLKMDLVDCAMNAGNAMPSGVPDKVDPIIHAVRRIATELRPGVLDMFGLVAAVENELETFQIRSGIGVAFSTNCRDVTFEGDQATALFRILQETLTNVARHAHASLVEVKLFADGGTIALTVSDNGVGIGDAASRKTKSLGLLGMQERVRILGGQFGIIGEPGNGTKVSIQLPKGGTP